jgi:putative ABC transport system permease protein
MLRSYAGAFVDDVRFGLRMMGRTPAFTAVALLMIALGTGANAAMFSVIDAVMLRSPFTDPGRLAIVRVQAPGGRTTSAMSLAHYRSLLDSAPVFEGVAAQGGGQQPILSGLGEPRRMNVECVTADMFRVLGATTVAGRPFTPDEDRPGGPGVAILSYQFWQRELGGAPDAVGRVLTMGGVPTTVVGIMPRGFGGALSRNNTDAWLPLGPALDGASTAGCSVRSSVNVFARLRDGVTLESAARLATDSAGIARLEDIDGKTGARLSLLSLDDQTVSELRTPLLALLGAVGLVLLIACANVANLQMERIAGRRVELAVRMALGATRARTVRLTLTENLLLSVLGGIAGLVVAQWTLHLIVGLMPGYVPHLNEIEISGRILAATLAVACVAGLAVGAIPALQGTSAGLMGNLRSSSRTATRGAGWIRRALVAGQVALSLTLLVGASLMITTFQTLRPTQPGFNAADKLTANVRLQGAAAATPAVFFGNLFERLRAIPGVRSVAGSTYLPMSGMVGIVTVRTAGARQDVFSGVVTPNYFTEMEIPVVRGRAFEERDGAGTPLVAIVNEALARKVWPGGHALGAEIEVRYFDHRKESRQVVGVLRDTRSAGSDLKARAEVYMPFAQSPVPSMSLIVRASDPGDPRLAAQVRSALVAVDPTQVVDRLMPMQEILDSQVATPRFGAWLLGLFAGIALLLAAVGLAASITWWVAQRTREIGVRMALGANAGQVTRLVVKEGLTLVATGVVLGLAGAAASTRLLESWLYGVRPLDVPTFACSAAGMLAIAALASYLPARRAARIDPLVTLRAE